MKETKVFYGVFTKTGQLTGMKFTRLQIEVPAFFFSKEEAEQAMRVIEEDGFLKQNGAIIREVEVSRTIEVTGGSAGTTTYEIPTPKEKNYE